MHDDLDRPDEMAFRHRRSTTGRLAALTAMLLVLVGCSQTMDIETSSTRRTVPVEAAFVVPPPGGPTIVAVIQERQGRSATQQVLLASDSHTPGEDSFHVQIAAHSGERTSTPHNINAGMRAALPGVRMVSSPYLTQNKYGPFGYAIGRRGGSDLCIYAWQTIQSQSTLFTNQGKVDVRLRLCRTGATETQLLAVMYGYTVNAFLAEGQWAPYQPAPLSDAVGQPGSEIYPTGANGPAAVLQETAASTSPAPRPRPKRGPTPAAPAPTSAVIIPAPTGPTMPLPPASGAPASAAPVSGAPVPPPPTFAAPALVVPPPPGS